MPETHDQRIARLLEQNNWKPFSAQDFADTLRAIVEDAKQEATQNAVDQMEREVADAAKR